MFRSVKFQVFKSLSLEKSIIIKFILYLVYFIEYVWEEIRIQLRELWRQLKVLIVWIDWSMAIFRLKSLISKDMFSFAWKQLDKHLKLGFLK